MPLNQQLIQALLAQASPAGQGAPAQPSQDAFGQAQDLINRNQGIPNQVPSPESGAPLEPEADPSIVQMAQKILDEGLPFPPAGTPLMAAIQSLMQTREAPAALEAQGSSGFLPNLKAALGNVGG